MNILKMLMRFFTKKYSKSAPILIIKKKIDAANVKEYKSIEEAIADLENDPNVSSEKIEKLRSSFNSLKNKSSIKIMNDEIIK